MNSKMLRKTPLHELALKAGGRMVPFAGWEMPTHFSGLIQEHEAVRKKIGFFDISHMGIIKLTGQNPKDALQKLVPTDLHRISPGQACYTLLLNDNGGIIDDLIIYDLDSNQSNEESLIVVINASCTTKDINWIKQHLEPEGISICNCNDDKVLLALQGPHSRSYLEKLTNSSLDNMPNFSHQNIKLNIFPNHCIDDIFLARTGYTGEDGFEILLSTKQGHLLWNHLIDEGVTPCGLGSRNTLRLEAGMHLYGEDINETTTPFEAGLGWLVHLEMPKEFIGRKALENQAEKGHNSSLVGLKLKGRAIPRKGNSIIHEGKKIGEVTSGSWAPTLKEPIAMAYINTELAKAKTKLAIEIRGHTHPAEIVKRPFYRSSQMK